MARTEEMEATVETMRAQYTDLLLACQRVEAKTADLRADALALVNKLNHVHDSASYQAVWTLWQSHCGPYAGPQYRDELDALKSRFDVELSA